MTIEVHELSGTHNLMVRSLSGLNPCGCRLHKSDPWPLPDYNFKFPDRAKALAAQRLLQTYIDNPPKAKKRKIELK